MNDVLVLLVIAATAALIILFIDFQIYFRLGLFEIELGFRGFMYEDEEIIELDKDDEDY